MTTDTRTDTARSVLPPALPTLVVGLGGWGGHVATSARHRYSELCAEERVPLAVLHVDTAPEPEGAWPDGVGMEALRLDADGARAWLRRTEGQEIPCHDWPVVEEWFPRQKAWRLLDALDPTGDAGLRPLGRLAAYHRAIALRAAIRRGLEQVRAQQTLPFPRCRVVIVTSCGGGTGSGMLWDTLALTRRECDVTEAFVVLGLPQAQGFDVPHRRRAANAYATLKEALHLRAGNVRFEARYDGIPTLRGPASTRAERLYLSDDPSGEDVADLLQGWLQRNVQRAALRRAEAHVEVAWPNGGTRSPSHVYSTARTLRWRLGTPVDAATLPTSSAVAPSPGILRQAPGEAAVPSSGSAPMLAFHAARFREHVAHFLADNIRQLDESRDTGAWLRGEPIWARRFLFLLAERIFEGRLTGVDDSQDWMRLVARTFTDEREALRRARHDGSAATAETLPTPPPQPPAPIEELRPQWLEVEKLFRRRNGLLSRLWRWLRRRAHRAEYDTWRAAFIGRLRETEVGLDHVCRIIFADLTSSLEREAIASEDGRNTSSVPPVDPRHSAPSPEAAPAPAPDGRAALDARIEWLRPTVFSRGGPRAERAAFLLAVVPHHFDWPGGHLEFEKHLRARASTWLGLDNNDVIVEKHDGVDVWLHLEDLFHPPGDITGIEDLHDAYSAFPAQDLLHVDRRFLAESDFSDLLGTRDATERYCGNPDCSHDIAGVPRGTRVCPACHDPIRSRCGNAGCLLEGLDGAPDATARTCPKCGGLNHAAWWACPRHGKIEHLVPIDKVHCPTCIERHHRDPIAFPADCVGRRPAPACERLCPGCETLRSREPEHRPFTIEPDLWPFVQNGVNGHERVLFLRLARKHGLVDNARCPRCRCRLIPVDHRRDDAATFACDQPERRRAPHAAPRPCPTAPADTDRTARHSTETQATVGADAGPSEDAPPRTAAADVRPAKTETHAMAASGPRGVSSAPGSGPPAEGVTAAPSPPVDDAAHRLPEASASPADTPDANHE